MNEIQKKMLLYILDDVCHRFASETCDEHEFPYSQEMYNFLVGMYKFIDPDESTEPYIYKNQFVVGMSQMTHYIIELVKNIETGV